MSEMNFTTREINIKTIVDEQMEFLIPVYQRPYVWDDREIKKLLEDLKYNFENNNLRQYFVGNTYAIKSGKENKYEVIDGQQRFTTFWLISLCFKTLSVQSEIENYLEIQYETLKDIRFDFDIRKEVYEYLKGLLDGTTERRFEDVSRLEFLKNIASGIETIKGYLNTEIDKNELQSFGNYIYQNVKFVFNQAPKNTDLNALFVALGTSGVQLQQSDILKARLLDKLDKGDRVAYAKVWEACENMNNYFESNVKVSLPYDTSKVVENDFKKFDREKFDREKFAVNSLQTVSMSLEQNKGFTIQEIINEDNSLIADSGKSQESNSECRSIISFNVFLLHVLRIYRKRKEIEVDVDTLDPKKLLQTFNINQIDNVREFIELMWRIRYLFDKHIVKWLKDEDESFDEEEKLLLSYINTAKNEDKAYFSRKEKEFSNIQMLQSVLYFTGSFIHQYWLSPFLNFLLENEDTTDEFILKELERIDNIMLPGDKKEISWQILIKKESGFDIEHLRSLKDALGVHFNHYWFYKLEYLLWKSWDRSKTDQKFNTYRITSKNSVEHIFPQHQEYKAKLEDLNDNIVWLNSFGNLALLSVGQNSSYSNQDVDKKRIDFSKKTTYDSLKLAKIYAQDNWNSEQIREHQEEMIEILVNHYKT